MFTKALIAFLVLPGVVAFIVPISVILLSDNKETQFFGLPVLLFGFFILLNCVKDFYIAGKGTLAPWAPPQKLVTKGLYKFSRNPMYLGVISIVAGWAILFKSITLLIYTLILCFAFHIRVVRKEEPWLKQSFGQEWDSYILKVPRWMPCFKKSKNNKYGRSKKMYK